jgi:vitamin-K-epoxide reductase (warfarin-sensitive)
MRFLLMTLALAGVIVSALALHVHYSNDVEPCDINEKWDCGIVNHSPFAEIVGIPVAALGIVGYLAIGVFSFRRLRALAFLFALVAFGYALYLSHIEKDVLQVWCVYCVISQCLIALITILSGSWYFWARKKLQAS